MAAIPRGRSDPPAGRARNPAKGAWMNTPATLNPVPDPVEPDDLARAAVAGVEPADLPDGLLPLGNIEQIADKFANDVIRLDFPETT